MKLSVLMGCAAVMALPIFAAEGGASSKFTQDFLKHWDNAKALTIAVAEAMPEGDYSFKPNPEEMSFGEQIVHIGAANYSYCSRLKGEKSPYKKPEMADRATAIKVVGDSFDYCSSAISGVTDWSGGKGPMDNEEVALGVLTHMAHHRGQAEVYLRVKGIKPPTYKF